MSDSSSFDMFLANVLKPRAADVGDAMNHAEEACSDAGSSSWLHPCSKPRDESLLAERVTDGADGPLPDDEPISIVPVRADELVDEAPILVDVKAEMEEFDNAVERRRLDRVSVSNVILKTSDNTQAVHTLLASQGCNWDKHFSLRCVEKARAFFGGSSVSSFYFSDSPEEDQSEMGKRSFRDLAAGSADTSKAPAPPRDSSAPRATSTPSAAPSPKKPAHVSSSLVLTMPAGDPKAAHPSASLAVSRSGDDARRKAKGKSQNVVGADRRGSESWSTDGREPKRPRTDPPSPVKVSQSVFDDDSAAARLFATLAFPDDPCGPVQASASSGTMSRARLRFLAFVNRVCHELEDKVERHKLRADACAKGESVAKAERNKYADKLERRNKELEKALGDNERLRAENKELSRKLEVAEKNASNSFSCLSDRNAQVAALKMKVRKKRMELKTAKVLIVDLYEQFSAARAKFEELKGIPQNIMVFQIQREANLDLVKQLMGLIPERKVPKLQDELASLTADVEAHAGDEEYFDKLMETLGECLDVVLPEFAKPSTRNQDASLEFDRG
ncbi:hypothetical protein AALP_AA4G216200 [Arabis alpina]|uniref:Uncharacterized protein n=1 Tax=Arabis alpina TaxID=50452 RepID=A0A087H4S4_ARAAL|nr:hypothetical protein AALP_AA4G216200 [Arabis alpina]